MSFIESIKIFNDAIVEEMVMQGARDFSESYESSELDRPTILKFIDKVPQVVEDLGTDILAVSWLLTLAVMHNFVDRVDYLLGLRMWED